MRELKRRILAAGLTIESGKRHDKILSPEGKFLTPLAVSPSDTRFYMNICQQLKREGYDILQ